MAPIHLLPNYSLMLCLPRSTINDTAPMEHVVCCLRCLLRRGLWDSFVFLVLYKRCRIEMENNGCCVLLRAWVFFTNTYLTHILQWKLPSLLWCDKRKSVCFLSLSCHLLRSLSIFVLRGTVSRTLWEQQDIARQSGFHDVCLYLVREIGNDIQGRIRSTRLYA